MDRKSALTSRTPSPLTYPKETKGLMSIVNYCNFFGASSSILVIKQIFPRWRRGFMTVLIRSAHLEGIYDYQ